MIISPIPALPLPIKVKNNSVLYSFGKYFLLVATLGRTECSKAVAKAASAFKFSDTKRFIPEDQSVLLWKTTPLV